MAYLTRPPHPALASMIESLGVQHDPVSAVDHPPTLILPTGTCELVFHYGDPFVQIASDGPRREPEAYIATQRITPLQARATGSTGVVVVTLQPWAAPVLLQAPASSLQGTTIDLAHFFAAADLRELCERIATAADAAQRIDLVEAFLLARMRGSGDALVQEAVLRIARIPSHAPSSIRSRVLSPIHAHAPAAARIGALATTLGISRRQLDRRFAASVGMAPKSFARVLRFQAALGLLRAGATAVDAACSAGYHDQPHMQRDFVSLAGHTPRAMIERQGTTALMAHFNRRDLSRFYNTMYLH